MCRVSSPLVLSSKGEILIHYATVASSKSLLPKGVTYVMVTSMSPSVVVLLDTTHEGGYYNVKLELVCWRRGSATMTCGEPPPLTGGFASARGKARFMIGVRAALV